MPGLVLRVAVERRTQRRRGLAPAGAAGKKMEQHISAPADGVVAVLDVKPGQKVEVGAVLAVVQPEEDK
jgi:propionyl-CoA carboxylase alpha chain